MAKVKRKIRKCMIGGHEFKVVWKDLSKAAEGGGALFGQCLVDEKIIEIEITLENDAHEAWKTLCHEAHHAVLELSALRHMEGFGFFEEAVVRTAENFYLPAIDDISTRMGRT